MHKAMEFGVDVKMITGAQCLVGHALWHHVTPMAPSLCHALRLSAHSSLYKKLQCVQYCILLTPICALQVITC